MNARPGDLRKSLGYPFQDQALLERALTHRSAGSRNNERLEFLGDAVLGMLIAEVLYRSFPEHSEGELSRLRSTLVRRETLAVIARELGLGEHLHLGSGELKSGGFRRDSILADALEAIIGAVYLDGGLEAARALVQRLWQGHLEHLPAAAVLKDAKTRLQEYLQARHLGLPEYRVLGISGQAHEQTFEVECRVEAVDEVTRATGSSRRRAEQQAAADMLERLGANG